ncbi:MAG: TetR/AcrR family transcriptional regulator [Clostridiales bacterium]|nr:TetR/AcrR family transcriptional regulator [Clostridiales bacterium]
MAAQNGKRTDRRVQYTRRVIKDAFLAVLAEKGYEKMSVSSVCAAAEVTRTTFYAHYDNLDTVLDELVEEAFDVAECSSTSLSMGVVARLHYLLQFDTVEQLRQHNSDLPACQRIADDPKYRALFLDGTLSEYIQNKLYRMNQDKMVPDIMDYCGISRQEAQRLYRYMLSGSYAANTSLGWVKDDAWFATRLNLIRLEAAGLDAIRQANKGRG